MAKYFLSYDLRNNRNYTDLYLELEKFNAIKILESLYCFRYTQDKHAELRDYFASIVDKDDGLIVIEARASAWKNVHNKPTEI